MSKWDSEKENLEKLILEDKISYEEIGRIYGCTGSNIKKVSQRLGINLPQKRVINECETFRRKKKDPLYCLNCNKELLNYSSGQKKYCSNNCQQEYQSKEKYQYFLTSPKEYQRANFNSRVIKRFILEEQNNKCSICGLDSIWNNKPLVMILDHIDGNAANNIRENYRCICPNCDSQLDTYKSKNKNGARSYYRYNKENGGILGSNMQE